MHHVGLSVAYECASYAGFRNGAPPTLKFTGE
jgi:hypothetical protein